MLNDKQDIAVFFHDQVVGPYNEFMRCRNSPEIGGGRDLQAALNAAEAIYHFREQLGDAFKPEEEDVIAKCPDYALTRDVTNFKKHGRVGRESLLRRINPIEEVLVITTYKDAAGEYQNSVKEFKLHLKDDTLRELSEVLTNSINFWCRYLAEKDVSPKFSEFPVPNPAEPLPRSKCTSNADMLITRGLKFPGATLNFQRYNYSTGRVEPMNLIGFKPMARVFEPRHEIVFGLRNDSTGEQFQETITLNPEQSDEFDALTSDEERQNYISKLPQVISAYARLVSQAAESSKSNEQRGESGADARTQ